MNREEKNDVLSFTLAVLMTVGGIWATRILIKKPVLLGFVAGTTTGFVISQSNIKPQKSDSKSTNEGMYQTVLESKELVNAQIEPQKYLQAACRDDGFKQNIIRSLKHNLEKKQYALQDQEEEIVALKNEITVLHKRILEKDWQAKRIIYRSAIDNKRELCYKSVLQNTQTELQEYRKAFDKDEDTIRSLKQDLGKKESELKNFIDSFDPEIQEQKQRIQKMAKTITNLEEEKARLLDQLQRIRSSPFVDDKLPSNITLLCNSRCDSREVYQKMASNFRQKVVQILENLETLECLPPNLRPKQLREAHGWMEIHLDNPNNDLRLYYRKY